MNTVPCITIDILSCRKEKIQIKWQENQSDKKDQMRTILLFEAEKYPSVFGKKAKQVCMNFLPIPFTGLRNKSACLSPFDSSFYFRRFLFADQIGSADEPALQRRSFQTVLTFFTSFNRLSPSASLRISAPRLFSLSSMFSYPRSI